jgi:SNF family Na+-dependent transporter
MAGYPLLVSGLIQVLVVIWIYGADKLKHDIECMIGKKSELFWKFWFLCWKFLCPAVLIVTFALTKKV